MAHREHEGGHEEAVHAEDHVEREESHESTPEVAPISHEATPARPARVPPGSAEHQELMAALAAQRARSQEVIDGQRARAEAAALHARAAAASDVETQTARVRRNEDREAGRTANPLHYRYIEHRVLPDGTRGIDVAVVRPDASETRIPLQELFQASEMRLVHDTRTFFDEKTRTLHLGQIISEDKETNLSRVAIEIALAHALGVDNTLLSDTSEEPQFNKKHVEAMRAFVKAREELQDTIAVLKQSPNISFETRKERYEHVEHAFVRSWKKAQEALLAILRDRSKGLQDLTRTDQVAEGFALEKVLGLKDGETTDHAVRQFFRPMEEDLVRPREYEHGEFRSEATGDLVEPKNMLEQMSWWWSTTELAQEKKIWGKLGEDSIPLSRKALWTGRALWGGALMTTAVAGWGIKQGFRAIGLVGRLPYKMLAWAIGHPKLKADFPTPIKWFRAGAGWLFEKGESEHDAHAPKKKEKSVHGGAAHH